MDTDNKLQKRTEKLLDKFKNKECWLKASPIMWKTGIENVKYSDI